jgi:hypothetical protein
VSPGETGTPLQTQSEWSDRMHTCVSQRPKRPQLSDTINRLDEMIETLSTAIPGAVSESVREVLGASLVAAIGDAVREAVKVGVREGVQAAVGEAVALATAPASPVSDPNAGAPPEHCTTHKGLRVWVRVRALAVGLRRWAARRAAPVVARLTIGWAIVKLIGGSTIRSRSAALSTALVGAGAGYTGYVVGPISSGILLGLAGGAITAIAAWAAPTVCLLMALRDE